MSDSADAHTNGHVAEGEGGYGPLVSSSDCPGISVPRGFRASRVDRTGDLMSDGTTLPAAVDGMGAFASGTNRVRLIRNHELRDAPGHYPPLSRINAYDAKASAGATTLELEVLPDGDVRLLRSWVSLSGTLANCAGGPTPWGSWLSCEEAVTGTSEGFEANHGYVFEVPASADGPVEAVPLRAMGRFAHEAVAVDPDTGIAYLTEDRQSAGFYRFVPNTPGRLVEGGRLQMLAIDVRRRYDTRRHQTEGQRRACSWIDIEQPDSDAPNLEPAFVFNQGFARGGAVFARLEGCWWGNGSVYITATSGGDAKMGQVFRYRPAPDGGELELIFESPTPGVLNMPDNVTVSPRGGIVLCEDGDGTCYVRGLTNDGAVFDIVRNDINDSEWSGACWSPQGRTLFVNMQGPASKDSGVSGGTYAIRGPWENGAL